MDFTKFNVSSARPVRADTPAALEAAFADGCDALLPAAAAAGDGGAVCVARGELAVSLRLSFPAPLQRDAGAPASAWLLLRAAPGGGPLAVAVAVQHKTPTRLPEATWLRLKPGAAAEPESWAAAKLGAWISPRESVKNGSAALHAVSAAGVRVASAAAVGGDDARRLQLTIGSADAALACFGDHYPLPTPPTPPDLSLGASFCLHNNAWGTNFPQWVPYRSDGADQSLAFRFSIEVTAEGEATGRDRSSPRQGFPSDTRRPAPAPRLHPTATV
jgi:hypothetical protein